MTLKPSHNIRSVTKTMTQEIKILLKQLLNKDVSVEDGHFIVNTYWEIP